MYRIAALVFLFFIEISSLKAQHLISSPDEKIKVNISTENGISYSVSLNDEVFIAKADIDLIFNKTSLGKNIKFTSPVLIKQKITVKPVVALKQSSIENNYNQLTFKGKELTVEFRVFNDGVAYRFVTDRKGEVEVNERANFEFSGNFSMWTSPIEAYVGSYEANYDKVKIADFSSKNTYLPVLFENIGSHKMLITEADIYDYPHMFLKKGGVNALEATFPPFPLETELVNDRASKVTKVAEYIAKTQGARSFPWRVMALTEKDAQLVESNLVYLLSRETELKNTEWIRPGRVSWDWWNASNLYGVDFEAGLNTDSYKYFIDFASKNGLEYIILDEGWSLSTLDISQPNQTLDLFELIRYGREKNVRLILWASWRAIESQFFVLSKYKEWGIAGIKVDFMDRADQWMVNFYERVAREAAANNLLVDFHGAFKPNGLHRAYPNVVAYEGVQGLEYNKWAKTVSPEHNTTLPFIRMVCGPMDYTPGAMRNYQSFEYNPSHMRPGSQGTRCHQLAMFVIYESGIQMLADSPSNYEREKESTDFIASVPNTWDEIKVLEARVGEYLLVARRKGNTWFVGGMNNDTEREFTISLPFLSTGEKKAVIIQDGINANRFAEDYTRIETDVNNQTQIKVKMAKGGGFVMRIE